ncbi:MAG: PAS domain S-box protein [Nitrospinae bacterium]|nr:PAS domain S-box protein [Nitrospinota bacterium]
MVEWKPEDRGGSGGQGVAPSEAALLIHDGDRLLESDGRLAAITGHTVDDLRYVSLLPTLFAPVSLPYVQRVIGEKDATAHIFFARRKQGGLLPVEVTTRPGIYEGKPAQFTLICDVTAPRRTISGLNEWERRFRHTLDNVRMIAVQLDAQGTILYANDYLLELSGWRRDELVGANWFERFVPEKARAAVRQVHGRVMAGEMEMAAHFENPILTRDGTSRMVSWNNTLLLDESGGIIGSSSLGEDITDTLRVAVDLRASEARWRSLAEGSPDHVVTLAPDLTITYVNRPLPGLTVGEMVGASILTFKASEQRSLVEATLAGVLESGKSARYESRYPFPGEGDLYYETNAAPLFDDGSITGLTLVVRDITARKEDERRLIDAHRRLEEAIAEKDQYLSLIAHDIKSPLSGVRSMLQMIRENPARLQSGERDVGGAMIANIDKVLRLIDHMLAGRGTQGTTPLSRKVVSLRHLVDEAVQSLEVAAAEKGVAVENRIPESLTRYVDPALIHQLFMNLLSNAIKFSHRGGHVTVEAREDEDRIVVADTGVGIDPSRIPSLTDSSVTTTTPGTAAETGYGLGLPFCQKIVRLHGGELTIVSTPGVGTRVAARLPERRPVALIVDDDELIRIVYGARLRDMGLSVQEAGDGVSAMGLMEREKPDLVLCDIHMAPGDGFETLRWARDRWEATDLPFYLVSSDSRPDTREKGRQMGANGLLVKPISEEALDREIRTHLFV